MLHVASLINAQRTATTSELRVLVRKRAHTFLSRDVLRRKRSASSRPLSSPSLSQSHSTDTFERQHQSAHRWSDVNKSMQRNKQTTNVLGKSTFRPTPPRTQWSMVWTQHNSPSGTHQAVRGWCVDVGRGSSLNNQQRNRPTGTRLRSSLLQEAGGGGQAGVPVGLLRAKNSPFALPHTHYLSLPPGGSEHSQVPTLNDHSCKL